MFKREKIVKLKKRQENVKRIAICSRGRRIYNNIDRHIHMHTSIYIKNVCFLFLCDSIVKDAAVELMGEFYIYMEMLERS